MSEVPEADPNISEIGNIFEFTDATELAAFEDLVAQEVDPKYNRELWAGREALRGLIRPPTFNGTMAAIKLEVMAEPYERLLDAKQRGWTMRNGSGGFKLSSEFADKLIPRYRGFILTAEPRSSSPGPLKQIQAELWYYPLPLSKTILKAGRTRVDSKISRTTGEKKEYISTRRQDVVVVAQSHHGEAIRRVITKPKLETEAFIEHHRAAKRIGVQVLSQQIARPISNMREY